MRDEKVNLMQGVYGKGRGRSEVGGIERLMCGRGCMVGRGGMQKWAG